MPLPQNKPSIGVLHPKKSDKNYQLKKWAPSKHLTTTIGLFWHVQWSLDTQESHLQQNIPDPCVHLCFEKNNITIVGPVSKCYQRELSEAGDIFAIKFRPGGFKILSNNPIADLKDQSVDITDFEMDHSVKESLIEINQNKSLRDRVTLSEQFLLSLQPNKDSLHHKRITSVNSVIDVIKNDQSINNVHQLCQIVNMSIRNLQRLFKEYIGLSPKWVIRKFRVQDFLTRSQEIETQKINWAELANELGYFDQAHFIKDIKTMIGQTPHEYAHQNH